MQHDVALPRKPWTVPSAYDTFFTTTLAAGRDGVTQEELVRLTGLDRTTIFRASKKAKAKKQIRIVNDGKNTRYIALSDIVVDPELGSLLQGKDILRTVIKDRGLQPIDPARLGIDFFDKLSPAELAVFLFSARVGLSYTYIVLQAMATASKVLSKSYKSKDRKLSDTQKDELVQNWIRGASSPILQQLPYEFKDLMYRVAGRVPQEYEKRAEMMLKRPRLVLDGKTAQEIGDAFAGIFPQADKRLQAGSARLPNAIKREKKFIARAEEVPPRPFPNDSAVKKRDKAAPHKHDFVIFKVDRKGKHKQCKVCRAIIIEPVISRDRVTT